MYRLKYRVTKRNDMKCIVWPKYLYNRHIGMRYRALV